MEKEGIKLMNQLKKISIPKEMQKVKSTKNKHLATAYLAFPPQMKFVPSDIELEKLIWNGAKFRYVKDIPTII